MDEKKILIEKIKKKSDEQGNIYSVFMHGMELDDKFTVPKGVKLIMFCYSGRKLYVCKRFNKFIWKNLFLNENSTYNYLTFISTLSQYSSLRDHFCVYKEGDIVKNLYFENAYEDDNYFLSGIFKLPIKVSVKDEGKVYSSSEDIMMESIIHHKNANIKVDIDKIGNTIIYPDKDFRIYSYYKRPLKGVKLSNLISDLKSIHEEFTLAILTCRTSDTEKNERDGIPVFEELKNIIRNLKNKK
jgi:hypothetical protein